MYRKFKKIRYSVVFNRLNRLNSYGEGLIQVRAYQNAKSRYFSTEISVKPERWDKKNKKINISHPNHFVYNQRIFDQLKEMEAFEIAMINRYQGFPIDRLGEYSNHDIENKSVTFTQFFADELEVCTMKPNSLKMYELTLRKLKSYRETVYFEDLTYEFVKGFDRFLHKQGQSLNYIHKHHARLKTFIIKAIKEDYILIDKNPYKKFRAKKEEPERGFLLLEELNRIEDLVISDDDTYLQDVKDIFLFQCYTGLRFSDVIKITPGHISKGAKGYQLSIKAEKTNKRLQLPLWSLFRTKEEQSRPEKILQRFFDQIAIFGDTKEVLDIKFFKRSNQYFNRSLKLLAERAKINKPITSHYGRRTFATIMATKVKAAILQKLLQHSRPDMTSIYIQLGNGALEEELEKTEWK